MHFDKSPCALFVAAVGTLWRHYRVLVSPQMSSLDARRASIKLDSFFKPHREILGRGGGVCKEGP